MGHEDELTIELQEILNEEHQETQRNVSPSEQEEDERGPMPTSVIKDFLKKREAVRAMVLEWHPNQTDVSRGWGGPFLHLKLHLGFRLAGSVVSSKSSVVGMVSNERTPQYIRDECVDMDGVMLSL
ncbi:uncharacterized protein TNCV_5070981 [Trichonephila clavipes]|nr:uncharacterized protein TNCV_5070981 [Trichonephila clavipes]